MDKLKPEKSVSENLRYTLGFHLEKEKKIAIFELMRGINIGSDRAPDK